QQPAVQGKQRWPNQLKPCPAPLSVYTVHSLSAFHTEDSVDHVEGAKSYALYLSDSAETTPKKEGVFI
ncbi:hypothetical protein, partial [Mycobacterium leprae]